MPNLNKISRGGLRFNRKQAAKYIGVTEGTLSVWACTGRYNLPFLKAGRKAVYFQSDLDAFIDRHMTGNHGGFPA